MATNRRLRADLLNKLGVTPQRLSQRVAQVKRLYGPMSTEEGTCVLAHQEGLDLTKYLDRDMVDRVRSLLPKNTAGVTTASTPQKRRRAASRGSRPIRVAPTMELVDPMLPTQVAEDAAAMASIYPKLYLLENSLRNVISRVLEAAHGKNWWTKAPTEVQNHVRDRQAKEDKTPWHGKRGTHEIYYSDFGDLRKLITNNWNQFKGIIPSQPWITQKLEELEPPRNVIAHNNPLSAQDRNRIDLYFNDWVALLNDRRDVIP